MSAQIIPFRVSKQAFEPWQVSPRAVLAAFDLLRDCVPTAAEILTMNPQQLKRKLAALIRETGPGALDRAILDLNLASAGLEEMVRIIDTAASRLEIVTRR